tara:strand:- start:1314 stop:1694 length:381 start_codon:yes stop_codon:yes gene_type:complete
MSKTTCKWLEEDEQILIGPDGQVLPCCYLNDGRSRLGKIQPKDDPNTWVFDDLEDQLYHRDRVAVHIRQGYLYKEYQKRKDKLNIFTNSLEDIIANEWFTKILPESWEDPKKIASPCKRICTKCDE